MHVLLCVCSSRTRCSVLPPLGWRRLWPVEVASVSCLPCSCPFTYRSSRPPVWVPSHDADTLNNMALHVAVSGHSFARPQTLSGLPLTVCLSRVFTLVCFRSVSRASSSNIKPLQIISSTASRCFFFLF